MRYIQDDKDIEVLVHSFYEKVRAACIKAAQEGFRDASMSGLCMEGAVEAAVGSIRSLNLETVLKEHVDNA